MSLTEAIKTARGMNRVEWWPPTTLYIYRHTWAGYQVCGRGGMAHVDRYEEPVIAALYPDGRLVTGCPDDDQERAA